jgi:hypothetical protein
MGITPADYREMLEPLTDEETAAFVFHVDVDGVPIYIKLKLHLGSQGALECVAFHEHRDPKHP